MKYTIVSIEKQARNSDQWVHRWVCNGYVQSEHSEAIFHLKRITSQERNNIDDIHILEFLNIYDKRKTIPWFLTQKRMTKAQQAACIEEYQREQSILLFFHPVIQPQAWQLLVHLRRRWLQNMVRMLDGGFVPVIQEEVGPLVGMSRQSVNYYLRLFEEVGIIQRHHDPPKWATGYNSTYIKISYGLLSGDIEKFFATGGQQGE